MKRSQFVESLQEKTKAGSEVVRSRLMEVLLWLYHNGSLPIYWMDCAEPKNIRNYGYEDQQPGGLRSGE